MASEPGQEFNDVARYPYMCVASPSCHDTSTTRAWWEEDAQRRGRYFYERLDMQVRAPILYPIPYILYHTPRALWRFEVWYATPVHRDRSGQTAVVAVPGKLGMPAHSCDACAPS